VWLLLPEFFLPLAFFVAEVFELLVDLDHDVVAVEGVVGVRYSLSAVLTSIDRCYVLSDFVL
jgi:hypothetical protein